MTPTAGLPCQASTTACAKPSPAERAAIAAVPFDEAAYRALTGASDLVGEPAGRRSSGMDPPTLRSQRDVGRATRAPAARPRSRTKAFAKISCRLVPGQSRRASPPSSAGTSRRTARRPAASPSSDGHAPVPTRCRRTTRAFALAEQVLEEVHGKRPVRIRIGATLPVSEMFKRILGIDTMLFSFSTSDEDFHGPNEFFRVQSFGTGSPRGRRYWEFLGRRRRRCTRGSARGVGRVWTALWVQVF